MVQARDRNFGSWVVTHEQHEPNDPDEARRGRQKFTALPLEFPPTGDRLTSSFGEIAECAEYAGSGDIVIVSPSMAAGGVKYDGKVS